MGELYRLTWNALLLLGRRAVLWLGIGAIVLLQIASGGSAIDALPFVVMWALLTGAARFLAGLLPAPRQASPIDGERALPPAQLAVSVVETRSPEGCPDYAGMVEQLSPELRRLIKQS